MFEQHTDPLRFFLFLPVVIMDILIILLKIFLLPFFASATLSKVSRYLKSHLAASICTTGDLFPGLSGWLSLSALQWILSFATELLAFLLPSASLGRQTAYTWHPATTGSRNTLQRIQSPGFKVSLAFKIPTTSCFPPSHWEREGLTM